MGQAVNCREAMVFYPWPIPCLAGIQAIPGSAGETPDAAYFAPIHADDLVAVALFGKIILWIQFRWSMTCTRSLPPARL